MAVIGAIKKYDFGIIYDNNFMERALRMIKGKNKSMRNYSMFNEKYKIMC